MKIEPKGDNDLLLASERFDRAMEGDAWPALTQRLLEAGLIQEVHPVRHKGAKRYYTKTAVAQDRLLALHRAQRRKAQAQKAAKR